MGAVFALFAAWYFWLPKAEGLTYNDRKGRLHFWGLFIGVIEKIAPSLVQLNEILFDTRKSYLVLNKRYLNYIKDYYSVNFKNHGLWATGLKLFSAILKITGNISMYFYIYQFKFNNFLFKFFTLTNNNLNAQLVEVKNSANSIADIQKASQRLNTKDIQWLIGFTDGDGCLTMYKEKKHLNNWRHEYTIGLNLKDIRLLYKIKKILGCGIIRKYNNVAIFRVKKIKHLIYNIIPIFDNYPLLTEKKRLIYINFRNTLLSKALNSKRDITNKDILFINKLLDNTPYKHYNILIEDLFKNIDSAFFENWLVGFTEAEGSFYFIKKDGSSPWLRHGDDPSPQEGKPSGGDGSDLDGIVKSETPFRAEFRLCQNNNLFLLNKIKEKLKIARKVHIQTKSSNHYYLVAASTLSLQNVINFYTSPNLVKLKGIKYLQFILWLKGIQKIVRHKKIKIPTNYGGDSS